MTTLAQASPSDSGVNRAADFQPPTGNPQTVPGEVFPETPALQNQGSDDVLQDKTTIQVPTTTPSAARQVTEARSSNWLIWLLVAAVVVVAGVLWLRRRRPTAVSVAEPQPAPEPAVAEKVAPKPTTKKQVRKPAPKKSKSQRKKRARR